MALKSRASSLVTRSSPFPGIIRPLLPAGFFALTLQCLKDLHWPAGDVEVCPSVNRLPLKGEQFYLGGTSLLLGKDAHTLEILSAKMLAFVGHIAAANTT